MINKLMLKFGLVKKSHNKKVHQQQGLFTGIPSLDVKEIENVFVTIMGRAGRGKSTFSRMIAKNTSDKGNHVLYLNYDGFSFDLPYERKSFHERCDFSV